MSNITDSGPAGATFILTVLAAIGKIVIWYAKRLSKQGERAMSKVPPSPQFAPPPSDPAVLRRMDQAEYESALSVALYRERGVVDDLRRELAETRAERDQLLVDLRAAHALVHRLRADLAKARARGRTAAVEVTAATEHQDASVASTLQDSLKTLPPPSGRRGGKP